MPTDPSELMELCRLAVPWKAVNCSINATPMTITFLAMRRFSYLPALSRNNSRSISRPVCCWFFVSSSLSTISLSTYNVTACQRIRMFFVVPLLCSNLLLLLHQLCFLLCFSCWLFDPFTQPFNKSVNCQAI